jgi:imidazolonepropionase-like amidohydrolase
MMPSITSPKNVLAAGLMIGSLASPAAAQRTALSHDVFAIVGATAIPMTGPSVVIRDATILVRDGRIAAIGPAASVAIPREARRVDGRGKFVIPGLTDMHGHLYADEWVPDSVGQYELGVYLAHGVTTARLMIGTPLHFTLRSSVQSGALAGPQLWIASPEVTGQKTAHSHVVTTPDEARRAVTVLADSGYDFIKLTTQITPEVYDAVVASASERRIPIVGHVDGRVGVARALRAGQQVEHLDNYMESVLAESAPSRESVSDVGAYRVQNWETLDHVDDRKVEAIAGATARAGVFVTPTLAFFRLWFATPTDTSVIRARPDYAHIPARMRNGYERARTRYWQNPPSAERRARYIAVRNRMVKAIVDSGGKIMAGSDGPGGLMGYGWTLHRELEMLVDAGLTPYQALEAATTVPAQFLRANGEWGALRTGSRADLVLLDADPLARIGNSTRISAVSVGGRLIERAALDDMIEQARVRLNPPPG